jgi:hypothetical protein
MTTVEPGITKGAATGALTPFATGYSRHTPSARRCSSKPAGVTFAWQFGQAHAAQVQTPDDAHPHPLPQGQAAGRWLTVNVGGTRLFTTNGGSGFAPTDRIKTAVNMTLPRTGG